MDMTKLVQRVMDAFQEGGSENSVLRFSEGLHLLRYTRATGLEATLYQPVICLILQGRKETSIGDRTVGFGSGESLIVSHDLPVVSQVTEASAQTPYLAITLSLDLGILRSLHDQIGETELATRRFRSLDVHATDAELIDALERYLASVRDPVAAEVLAPLILREIHFRILTAPHGGMLRKLLWRGSHASKIARAVARIRERFREPLVVPDLAESVGMSASSFHQHFRSVTETTPLQYQKELRLLEARRLLTVEGRSVSGAAYDVGYESPTQFSREYARKYGVPPRHDLQGRTSAPSISTMAR